MTTSREQIQLLTDVRLLAVLISLRVTASFTETATHLNLSKATVSKIVAKAEKNLGKKLCDRTTRSLAVNDNGVKLIASMCDVQHQVRARAAEWFEADASESECIAPWLADIRRDFSRRFIRYNLKMRIKSSTLSSADCNQITLATLTKFLVDEKYLDEEKVIAVIRQSFPQAETSTSLATCTWQDLLSATEERVKAVLQWTAEDRENVLWRLLAKLQ